MDKFVGHSLDCKSKEIDTEWFSKDRCTLVRHCHECFHVYPSCATDNHPASWAESTAHGFTLGLAGAQHSQQRHRLCRELTLTGSTAADDRPLLPCLLLLLPLQYTATTAPLAVCTNSHPVCIPHSLILPLPLITLLL